MAATFDEITWGIAFMASSLTARRKKTPAVQNARSRERQAFLKELRAIKKRLSRKGVRAASPLLTGDGFRGLMR